ncbi:hypothetical protein ACWC0A_36955 [Streptomyces scopuliridis]
MHKDVAYLTRKLGRRHPDTLLVRSLVSMWLSGEGQHADVLRLAEAEVADGTAEFGADDPETLRSRRRHSFALRGVGDLDGAVAEARAVVEDSVRVLGSDHADTRRCRADLAQYLAENGKPAEGVRLLRALYTESRASARSGTERRRPAAPPVPLPCPWRGGWPRW